jgi:hypothetical protein
MRINTICNQENQVEALSFLEQFTSEEDLKSTIELLKTTSSELKKISFKNCEINDSMVHYLFDIFDAKLFPKLTEIDLSNNLIGDQGFRDLLYIEAKKGEDYKKEFQTSPIKKTVILINNFITNPEELKNNFEETVRNNNGKILPNWDFEEDTWKDADPENDKKNPHTSPENSNQGIEINLKNSSMVNNQNQI